MYDSDNEVREYGPEYHKDEEGGPEQRSMGRKIFQAMKFQNQNNFGEFTERQLDLFVRQRSLPTYTVVTV